LQGVIHQLTVDEFVDHTYTPTTCCGEIFLSPKCRNYSRDRDQYNKRLAIKIVADWELKVVVSGTDVDETL